MRRISRKEREPATEIGGREIGRTPNLAIPDHYIDIKRHLSPFAQPVSASTFDFESLESVIKRGFILASNHLYNGIKIEKTGAERIGGFINFRTAANGAFLPQETEGTRQRREPVAIIGANNQNNSTFQNLPGTMESEKRDFGICADSHRDANLPCPNIDVEIHGFT